MNLTIQCTHHKQTGLKAQTFGNTGTIFFFCMIPPSKSLLGMYVGENN